MTRFALDHRLSIATGFSFPFQISRDWKGLT